MMAEGASEKSSITVEDVQDKILDSDGEAISQIHHSALRNGLSTFLHEGQFCDVTLVTKHQRFPCHRIILSTFSSFFKSMFTIGMKESEQEEIKLDVFEDNLIRKMLHFVYNGKVTSVSDTFDLLPLAVYFQIESLQAICEETLSKAVSLDNVCNLWKTSVEDFPQLTKLQNTCQRYVLQNFCKFTKTSDFLELKSQDLIFLISHQNLHASSEEFVCSAVTNWFQHNLTKRKEFLFEVFCHVHFPLLRMQFIEESFPFLKETALQSIMNETRLFSENPGIQANFDSVRCDFRPCYERERVLVVLGYFENYSHSEEFWCYHYGDKTWQLLIPPEQQTAGYQTCTYTQSRLLLTGGNDFLQYDGTKNNWTPLPCLDEARQHHCMAVVRENVYVLGGYREEDSWGSNSSMDTTRSVLMFAFSSGVDGDWIECGFLCFPVAKAAVAVSDKNIYLFSGICYEDPNSIYDFVQCFDTNTNQCTVIETVLPLGQIGQSFNWLHAYGYGDNIYLTNARKVWRFYGESGENGGRYLEEIHTFEREGCLAGFISRAQSLYFLGTMVRDSDSVNSVLTKGIAELKLSTKEVETLVDKALFLPSSCQCHNLTISKNIIDSRQSSFLW
ncbi:kelch-like protein 5 [Pecten maximus]|uniref:kelch-like protein 5 n=1 Tax=Pecten maximus TaxID=6579 RepID=UPI001457F103|nr:kelch-like protein 5 [Pecten maximus]